MKNVSCAAIAIAAFSALNVWAQSSVATPKVSGHAAARLLEQATWGPTNDDIEHLESVGIDQWLQEQFATPRTYLPNQPILTADGKPNGDMGPVQRAFLQNAVNGKDQLRQRVAFALSEIWVVSRLDVNYAYAFPPYWRIFQDNAFGNYRDVIRAVTLSPAMGHYLNMANNDKANPSKNTSANENYGREIMQLFALGLNQLNQDGSPVLDQNHAPVPTYDQTVVQNLSRVFTGWTYPAAPGAKPQSHNPAYFFGNMIPVESNHDTGAKMLFGGVQIPAGQTAAQDLESAFDALMDQPTMAPFVSKQLIEHLVTSNPSPGYVSRVAGVFLDNGSGVRGDLKAVVTAILTDEEARAADSDMAATDPQFGHLREPVLFLTGMLRALRANVSSTSTAYYWASNMGQNIFEAPSVFSYFSPQSRAPGGLPGPEFQTYSTATAAVRADAVNAALYSQLDKGTTVNLSWYMQWVGNLNGLLEHINFLLLHDSMSPALQSAALSAAQAATTPQKAVQAALYVVLTSAEYNVIH